MEELEERHQYDSARASRGGCQAQKVVAEQAEKLDGKELKRLGWRGLHDDQSIEQP